MPSSFHCLWLAILGLGWIAPALHAQVLIKEVISREISLHVGGVQTPEIKEVVSREISLNMENGPVNPYPQVISREVSVALGTAAAPPAVTEVAIQISPTGDSATLDWSAYNQWAVGDISHFLIFLSDEGAFADVTGMTPFLIVPGESTSVTLTGLAPWTDHFFAVVAVDVLGNFIPEVTYSAAYVLAPQVISREVSLFIGQEAPPPTQAVSSGHNFSFELPGIANFIYWGNMTPVQRNLFAWVASGNGANGGPAVFRNGGAWGYAAVPDGSQGVSLQMDSSISQQVDFDEPGAYRLQWRAASRGGNVNPYKVLLDDMQITSTFSTNNTAWQQNSVDFQTESSGSKHLTFVALNTLGGDQSVGIDAIELLRVLPIESRQFREQVELVSREVSVVVASTASPPAIANLDVTLSPTGDAATLNWSGYNQWAVGDVVRFDIYHSNTGPITDVTGMTAFSSVGAESNSTILSGLTSWTDHYFAVVAVDGLGNFTPAVNYSAGYVLAPQIISREMSLFVGAEPEPPYREVVSREISIVVPDATVPAPVTGVGSGFFAQTSTTHFGAVTLDWTSYNEIAQMDVVRYRVYVSDAFFDSVTGMEPFAFLPAGSQRQTLTGLTGLGIYHFVVVAEDVLGGFDPVVRSYSAQASVSGVGEARHLAAVSGRDELTFTWEAPEGTTGFLSGYRVYFGGAATPVELPASATTWTATDLEAGHGYPFRITTVNLFGGESSGAFLLGATWLMNPANAALTTLGNDVLMTWEAVQPAALVRYYAIYKSAAPFTSVAGMTPLFTRTGTSAVLGNFADAAGQHFAVVAVNSLEGFDPAVQSVQATKQAQTLDFPPLAAGPLQIPLAATASSGLPVTFFSSANAIAQVTGTVLQVKQGGPVTVTAQQAGDTDFWPVSASQTLRLPPVITSFTANNNELAPNAVLRQAATVLRVEAKDVSGIAQAEFLGRVPGAEEWTPLGLDTIPGNGLTALLPVEGLPYGPYELRVVVTAPGGHAAERTQTVVLDLQPVLTLNFAGGEIQEGGSLEGTVSIQSARPTDLLVTLASSQPAQLDAGPPVTIPAGQTSAAVTVHGRQDYVIEGPMSIRVTASAPGAALVERMVTLLDDDWPLLTFTVDRTLVSESDGPNAIRARIERDVVTPLPLTVWLTNTNPAAVSAPASVVIPGGAQAVEFPIGVIDTDVADGTQTASLRAEVRLSGLGAIVQTSLVNLTIGDDEGPTLELVFDEDYLTEGQSGLVRLRRLRSPATAALTVTLAASPSDELQTPSTVVIPAGAGEAAFSVTALQNSVANGNRTVRLNATANGFSPAQIHLIVTDLSKPDLVALNLAGPTEVLTEESFNLSYQVVNRGTAAVAQSFVQRVFLSRDRLWGDDILLAQSAFSGGLAVGSSFQRTENLRAPREAGTYWLIVVADATGLVEEIIESNNVVIAAEPLVVGAAYTATVQTEAGIVPANTPIIFTGSAINGSGAKVPNALVSIHIKLGETQRTIAAITNASGDFSTTWQPLPGEGGDYQVAATHPGTPDGPTQDTFSILTLKTGFPQNTITLDEASSASLVGTISNPTTHHASGVSVQALDLPVGLSVEANLPGAALAPGASMQAGVTITANAGFSGNRTVTLRVTTAQGISLDVPLKLSVRPLLPRLVISPNPLKQSALRGTQKVANVTLENRGGAESGPINVLLPNVPWMELASAVPLPSIAPGESGSFSLLLQPGPTDALTLHNGNLVVAPANGSALNLPFAIRVVSDQRGDLEIEVVDEYFYFTAEAPKVTGAIVTLRDALTSEEIASGQTNDTGLAIFSNVTEGWYSVEVSTPTHTRWKGLEFIAGGEINRKRIFVSKNFVSYTWTVEEIEIEDRYKITVESTFETNVPAPVITLTPSALDLSDLKLPGQTKVVNIVIDNHGFIAADHGRFRFDSHPFYEIVPLISEVGTIPAKSQLVVPVTIKRVAGYAENGAVAFSAGEGEDQMEQAEAESVPCSIGGGFFWDFICGPSSVPKATPVAVNGVESSCGSRYALPWGGGGSGGNGGLRPYSSPISLAIPDLCSCTTYFPAGSKICVDGQHSVKIPAVLSKLASTITKALPLGAKLERLDFVTSAGGEVCVCCTEDGLDYSANGEVILKVTGEIGWGPPSPPAIIPPLSGPWRLEEAAWDVDLGVSLDLEGEVKISAGKDCGEDRRTCVDAFIGLKGFVGAKGEASVRLTNLDEGVAYEGKLEGQLGGSASFGLQANWCMGSPGEIRACVDGNFTASISGQVCVISGVSECKTVTLGTTIPLFEKTCYPPKEPAAPEMPSDSVDEFKPMMALADASSDDLFEGVGYAEESFDDIFLTKEELLDIPEIAGRLPSKDGVCSTVKLRTDQEAVMTRSAFKANLELSNKQPDANLERIGFNLEIYDSAGGLVTDRFHASISRVSGVPSFDGTSNLAANATASVEWTLIPRDLAAPLGNTDYYIGGTIFYEMETVPFSVPVSASRITVRPDAALHLKYFHQRDVFSDDPHTDVIEPAIPYHLAVMVENRGAGEARNLTITSAQPEIIENEKGLLIDFNIIGTQVAGQPRSPSLKADFGNVPPNERKVATWDIVSSLQGLFIDYKATFQHLDGFGDERLSLIKEVGIHEMIKMIEAQGDLDDGLPDFLVNDIPDMDDRPDTVHLSDGTTAPVTVVEAGALSGPVSSSSLVVTLTTSQGAGWSYLRIPDPADGVFRLAGVTRSDGAAVPVGKNAWVTDRTFIGMGQRPVYENILHLADFNSTGQYTLTYAVIEPDVTPPTSSVEPLAAQSPAFIPVRWSGQDDRGVANFDIYVSVDGGPFTIWLPATTRLSSLYLGETGKTYAFYSRATDTSGNVEGIPSGAQATTTVSLENQPPVLEPAGPFVIHEGETLRHVFQATDPDGDDSLLRFSLVADSNAITLDAETGELLWSTQETDGGRVVQATVTVTDGGWPALSASETFAITVLEVNQAPRIGNVPPQAVVAGETLQTAITATDADIPQQTLTFGLNGTVPPEMSIDPASGLLTWPVSESETPRLLSVEVQVTDDGEPPLSATAQVSIQVLGTDETAAQLATVTTLEAQEIGSAGFLTGGVVTDHGGGAVTDRGIVYATTPNPTINSGMRLAAGAAIGTFSTFATKLAEDTEYHVRAYTTNSAGTAYGNEVVIRTLLDNGDEDGDGLVNLLEYALGTPPHLPDLGVIQASAVMYVEGRRFRLMVPRDPVRNDVIIEVQASSTLTDPWTTLATSFFGGPYTGPGYVSGEDGTPGVKTVEIRDVMNADSAQRRFYRVRVSR